MELKESHLVQTAEFTVAEGIDHEPAFNWWVKHVLKMRDRIIASIKKQQTRYLKKSHKFGIELSKTVKQVYAVDNKNGNILWADEIYNEMENVKVAFEVLPDGKSVPICYQFVQCRMVCSIKIEDFRQRPGLWQEVI